MEAEKRAVGALLLLSRLQPPPGPGPPRPRESGAPPARRPICAHTRAPPGASAPLPPTACPHRLVKDPVYLRKPGSSRDEGEPPPVS